MSKMIIDNRSSLDDAEALICVIMVIEHGRVSNQGKQYCYYTAMTPTGANGHEVGVATDLNKMSDRFVVVDVNQK